MTLSYTNQRWVTMGVRRIIPPWHPTRPYPWLPHLPRTPAWRSTVNLRHMLSDQDVAIIAEAYGLSAAEVLVDADTVQGWHAPQDDLLHELSRAHNWGAELAVRYLGALRRGLRRDPRTPD